MRRPSGRREACLFRVANKIVCRWGNLEKCNPTNAEERVSPIKSEWGSGSLVLFWVVAVAHATWLKGSSGCWRGEVVGCTNRLQWV